MKLTDTHPAFVGIPLGILVAMGILACAPSTTTLVQGDRSMVQITAGKLKSGDSDVRLIYILRDPHTNVDYLAVVDAGIIELKPKPMPKLEKP